MIRWRSSVVTGSLVAALLLVSCSDDSSGRSSSATTQSGGSSVDSLDTGSTRVAAVPGLSDDELIAAAIAALAEAGEPVGGEREPVLKRSDKSVEVSFPTRADLDPVVGGEAHVYLDPVTGIVLRISHTR